MGESRRSADAEVASVRAALELGYRLIDTAEMYGEGGAETVVGRAIAEALRRGDMHRDELCIVSKVYPHNASRMGTAAACDRSRKRLGLDRIDLYLLHWRGSIPLAETIAALQSLVADGRIGRWGVSNLDVDEMRDVEAITAAGEAPKDRCAVNQVHYSLSERGVEFSLLPWMRACRMPLMAYSPIGQGSLVTDPTLAAIAAARGLSAAQVALGWVLREPGVVAIPKASSLAHLEQNFAAVDLVFETAELRALEARFFAPGRKAPLAMI